MDYLCNFCADCEGLLLGGELEPHEGILEAGEVCKICKRVASKVLFERFYI